MIYENITCSVCGMACEDILVDIDDDHMNVENACLMGNAKLEELRSPHRIKEPYIDGKVAEWNEAIKMSADILKDATRPLLFIGSETSTEAMHVGIEMAQYLGGVVDSNATICHGPTVMGSQDAGKPSCTLGEVKNRADLARRGKTFLYTWGS